MALENKSKEDEIIGLDYDLNLYDLTDEFFACYRYHNEDCMIELDGTALAILDGNEKKAVPETFPRFEVLRRIEAMKLNSRPHMGGLGIPVTKYNSSLGYLSLLLKYLKLPYKALFSDNQFIKTRVNRNLYEILKLSNTELTELQKDKQNNPNYYSNAEISDTLTDTFNEICRINKDIASCHDFIPSRIVQDGFVAMLHKSPDQDFRAIPIHPLDLVFEAQALHDVFTWNTFFVIRKLSVKEVKDHIRRPGPFWNADALRWALHNSSTKQGALNYTDHVGARLFGSNQAPLATENFSVRSYYRDKAQRYHSLSGYYGNLIVVDAYYINADNKVTNAVFFPSISFKGVKAEDKERRTSDDYTDDEREKGIDKADVLYRRVLPFTSLDKVLTVVPFDRSELTLERQRGYGHELYNPIEALMRCDSSIMSAVSTMGCMFVKNNATVEDKKGLEEIELKVNGEIVDIGDRTVIPNPIITDLSGMIGTRQMILQHTISKAYLGGLDGTEQTANGRGANLANLRLVRDGRVHKHDIEDFAKGLKGFYTNILASMLKIIGEKLDWDKENLIIQRLLYDVIVTQMGFPKTLLTYKEEDVLEDTGLPYWINLEVVRNGASHFGPAEMILYSEIKQIWGDSLSQEEMRKLNRMGIKSILGPQDSIDIFGTPAEDNVTEQDQMYQAALETATILGSVDSGTVNFEEVLTRPDKDDDVAHLSIHNKKAEEIIKRLDESDVTPEELAESGGTHALETRSALILKLGALANHISRHQSNLAIYGNKRTDVNQLKELTNNILQSAEGLMNNLQNYLRTLEAKRQDEQLRLQNLSPENEAEKMKQQTEQMKLQQAREAGKDKLMLANKIADQRQQQHMDKQLSKAKDRELKAQMAERDSRQRVLDTVITQDKNTKDFAAKREEIRLKAAADKRSKSKEP